MASDSAFLTHWRSFLRDDLVAHLPNFLDRPEPRFAPWISILDVHDEKTLTVRLFGTRLAESFGEVTKLNFLDFMSKESRPLVGRAHRLVCHLPCGWITHSRAITSGGREVIPETTTLPLRHKGKIVCVVKHTRILDQLDYREGIVMVDQIQSEQWIDLGAGIPSASDLPPEA